jgi:hypothetical protein
MSAFQHNSLKRHRGKGRTLYVVKLYRYANVFIHKEIIKFKGYGCKFNKKLINYPSRIMGKSKAVNTYSNKYYSIRTKIP